MGILQDSVAVRNGMLDAWETTVGTAPILRLITNVGAMPADCATAQAGTTTVAMTLPTDWASAAAAGAKAKLGTWSGAASASGDLHYWRLLDSAATTVHNQGPLARPAANTTAYTLGQRVTNAGNVYRCTTAGTSGTGTPPTGTTTASDGTVTWTYESDASGVLVPDTFSVTNGQTVTVNTLSRTRGNA